MIDKNGLQSHASLDSRLTHQRRQSLHHEVLSSLGQDHPRSAFGTDDIGTIRNGKLEILGRYDQAINTGGLKVLPEIVESAARRAGYADCAVLGIPSAEWGESVCLVIERARESTPYFLDREGMQHIREQLDLPSYALPTSIAIVGQIPLRGPGKTDRHALRHILAAAQHR